MSDPPSLFQKGLLVLSIFTIGILLGLYWPDPDETRLDPTGEGPVDLQYPPRGGSLALGTQRFIYLPLNNPGVVPAAMASHMEGGDLVAGLVVEGRPRAYPQWILVAYHVVNDTIGGAPLMLAHCEICSGTSAFRPVVDGFEGKSLSFQIHGIAKGTFTVYDYPTQTVWSPFTGRTLEGRLHPSRMERIPLIVEPWSQWLERYPATEVVLGNRILIQQREHGRGETNQVGHDYVPEGFQKVANMSDTRLPRNELVFGITNPAGDVSLAFQLELLEEQSDPLVYPFDGHSVLLQRVGTFGVAAFHLEGDRQERSYRVVSRKPFRLGDDQGGRWDLFGNGVDGTESSLPVVDGYFTEWYEWVSSYPGCGIAGDPAAGEREG